MGSYTPKPHIYTLSNIEGFTKTSHDRYRFVIVIMLYLSYWYATLILSQSRALAKGSSMSNNDKLFVICMIGAVISFIVMSFASYRQGYDRGVRDGWHRGRGLSRQEFWEE